jgi:signal transduction histidine kinase
VQLQQVMLNLIVNGIQAINDVADGQRDLLITTEDAEDGVRVGVRDTGPGFSPEKLERLFEPFYTTKPNGMGMGLSICRSIVEAHGGRLWASGHASQGCGLSVYDTCSAGVISRWSGFGTSPPSLQRK